MAKVSMYFDTRHKSATGKQPLYYRVYLPGNRNFNIKTGLSIPAEWWDGYEIIKAPQREQMNRTIRRGRTAVEEALLHIQLSHGLEGPATEIKSRITAYTEGVEYAPIDSRKTFNAFYMQFMDCIMHHGTKGVYEFTYKRIKWFAEKIGRNDNWQFEEITIDWLKKFEYFLLTKHLDDSRHLHHRNHITTEFIANISNAYESACVIILNINRIRVENRGNFFIKSPIFLQTTIISGN